MKELHPRFRFHTRDWLTQHLLIMHCQVMSQSFARLPKDPNLVIYNNRMNKERWDKMNKADQGITKRRIDTHRQLALPGPKVNALFSTVNSLTLLSFRHCQNQRKGSLQYHKMLLWDHPQGGCRRAPAR